jgi:diguanylate cyclase (GGDEF)-like protein/PAS domain S-box-containing protein
MKALTNSFNEYFANKRIQQTPYYLIALLTFNMIVVVLITIAILYNLGFERQKKRLIELVETQAVMIQVVAQQELLLHENTTSPIKRELSESIIHKVSEAHYRYGGFEKTGEFTLGKREGKNIEFLIKQRHYNMDKPTPVPWKSHLGEPMRRALKGEKGTAITFDYRGAVVLAAYEPIKDLNWGIVAKMDLSEIRAPYIEAGFYALGLTVLLAFIGSFIFWYFLHPLVQNIEDSRHFNRMLITSSATGLALCSLEGKIIDANKSFLKIIALPDKHIRDLSYFDLIEQSSVEFEKEQFRLLLQHSHIDPYESRYIGKDNESIPVKISAKLISFNNLTYIWLSVDDISLEKAYEEQLLKDSHHDALTGLPNRLFFNQTFKQTLARAERSHHSFALFFIDINKFKEVNDTYGHECGDILLKTIAERLRENIRSDDFVARLGGDEFTILFESVKSKEESITVAKNLIHKTKEPIVIDHCNITPSISIGIAFFPEDGIDASTLLKSADQAMYHAKHQATEHYTLCGEL